MHFIVLKENLNKALSIVGKIIPIRPQLPILSNILFKTEENRLKIITTNLEIGITCFTGVKIEKEGEITVPGRLLIDFVNNLGTDKIEFKLENTILKLKSGKTQASFATSNSSDFPPFPEIPANKKTLPLKKIQESILRVIIAASTDESRPVLTGVKTSLSKGTLSLWATDGYRMSMDKTEIADKNEELRAILPAASLMEVVRVARETKTEEIGFSIIEDKNQVVFFLPNIYIFTRLIDGEFPNIEKVIPIGAKTKVIVDKDQFAQSVKTASLFARGAANIIKIKVEKEGLRLSANTPQVGEDEDFIEAKVEGEETEIAFNYRFLLDLLNSFPGKEVVFETSGALNPGVFKPTSGSFLHLIMPVRVQGG